MPAALATPYATPLTFRSEVRPQLYLASLGLVVIGVVFVGYFLTTPEAGLAGLASATVGVFMLYIAWINFWVTLVGHHLTVQSSDAVRSDLDLSALGEAQIVALRARRSATRVYLGFPPAAGMAAPSRRFVAPELAGFAETILLNGYTGGDATRAGAIADVLNARRVQPRQEIVLPPKPSTSEPRLRLIATASVFAVVWAALIWWRLLP